MITLTVSELPIGTMFSIQDIAATWLGQTRSVPGVLVSPASGVQTHVFEREYGYLRGDPNKAAVGLLRDKGVTHLNLQGDLTLSNRSYLVDVVGAYPRAKRATGAFVPYRSVEGWGSHGSESYTLSWSNILHQGDRYSALVQVTTEWLYDGEYLATYWTTTSSPYTKNGVPAGSLVMGKVATAFKRIGSTINQLASQGNFSGDLQTWLNTKKGLTGGLATNYNDLLVSSWGSPESISNEVFAKIAPLRSAHHWFVDEPVDFGELAVECAKQMNFIDTNILLLVLDVNDFAHFHKLWKGLLNRGGWKRAKALFYSLVRTHKMSRHEFAEMFNPASSLYLFGKYAILPNVSDVKHLVGGAGEFAGRPINKRLHSRREVPLDDPTAMSSTYTATLTVDVGAWPSGILGKIQELIGEAKRWGVFPAPENLYDLIPYSFVADWFVGFGDFLKREQRYLDVENYFPVDHCVLSSKWQSTYSSTVLVPEYPVSGGITLKYYHRWVTSEVPLPTVPPVQLGSGPISHGVESTALILQRL